MRSAHPESAMARGSLGSPGSRESRLLLAEDDSEMRDLLAGALRKEGYDVVAMEDGVALLAAVATSVRRGEPIDVVITDHRMPGLTGLGALDWLRELEQRIPVVVITAFGDEATHAEARRLGARAVLDKPFEIAALTRIVREVLACPGG